MIVILALLFVVPLGRGARLVTSEILLVGSFGFWYAYVILRVSPKGKADQTCTKRLAFSGEHFGLLWDSSVPVINR